MPVTFAFSMDDYLIMMRATNPYMRAVVYSSFFTQATHPMEGQTRICPLLMSVFPR